jgi:hypothetical protein
MMRAAVLRSLCRVCLVLGCVIAAVGAEGQPDLPTRFATCAAEAGKDQAPVAALLAKLDQVSSEGACWVRALRATKDADLIATLRSGAQQAVAEIRRRGGSASVPDLPDDAGAWGAAFATLGMERRRLRLAHLEAILPGGVVATVRKHIYPSFILYSEGLSDARAERYFSRGTRLVRIVPAADGVRCATLVDDPWGMLRDPDVDGDGRRVLFAWKKSDRNDDYHLHELDLETRVIRQVTHGIGAADYEGAYLPDGGIVFSSSRAEHSVPCWMNEVSNLYRMDRDGARMRRLAIDQVHAVHPKPTEDGLILYTRWDYSDRGQNFTHGLFQMRPDGTGQAAVYGNNSWFPTSILHARQIPGTTRLIAIAAGHHTPQQGAMIELDPENGRDEGKGLRFLVPRRDHPYERKDVAMQDQDLFAYPYPLTGEEFLVSWRPPEVKRFALVWCTADGDLELLQQDPVLHVLQGVPLRPRPAAHVIPDQTRQEEDSGTIYIADASSGPGMAGVPKGAAKRLRVVEARYRAATVGFGFSSGPDGGSHGGTPIATANGSWDVKAIVGETPIHPDGSVRVQVPAMKSLYFQLLDGRGRVLQTMRSWDTVQRGEVKSCTGCHSYYDNVAPPNPGRIPLALRSPPARLEPFDATGWNGFSFPRHVQPILDTRCVSCHDGTDPARLDLRGIPEEDPRARRSWSRSYVQLTASVLGPHGGPINEKTTVQWTGNPKGPWVRWISKHSEPTPLAAQTSGSVASPLMTLLAQGHGGLTDAEFRTIAAWIDLLVPFAGDHHEATAWTPEQSAFYAYYENKRRLNLREERANRARLLQPQSEPWFASALPGMTVRHERDGAVLHTQSFRPADLVEGGTVVLTDPLRIGDVLRVEGARSFRITLTGLPTAEIHAPDATWSWTVPAWAARVLPPTLLAVTGATLQVKPLRDEERGSYRNLAGNPFAGTEATAAAFPHATATSTCRSDPVFAPRNAIDGLTVANGHGSFPFQSWGPEQENGPAITVDFGREVRLDRLDVIRRADLPHDVWWTAVQVLVDDQVVVKRAELSRPQDIHTITWVPAIGRRITLRMLAQSSPGWCALTELRAWGVDADRLPERRIRAAGPDLAGEPLQ